VRRFLSRLIWGFLLWWGSKGPRPNSNDVDATASAWDYAEADKQPWTTEPDADRLSRALATRRSDPQGAIAELRALAALGSPRALNLIGESYYYGRGLPQDRSEGEYWFKLSFEAGNWRGLLNYGKALFYRRDLDAAARVFAAGVRERWGPAYYWTARIVANRPGPLRARLKRAMPWLVRASKMGSPKGRLTLHALTMLGCYGRRRRKRGRKLWDETYSAIHAQAAAGLPAAVRDRR